MVSGRGAIKVLGAGPPKTGTTSLKVALDRLGYRTVHGEFLGLTPRYKMWSQWEHGDPWPALSAMLDMGFDAACDEPWIFGYRELLLLNPGLKVVLNQCPSGAEVWAEKYEPWTWRSRASLPFDWMMTWNRSAGVHFADAMTARHLGCIQGYPIDGHWSPAQTKACADGYTAWLNQVRADVPPHQLLEYNVTQGWQPLCEFLGIADCPSEPFPQEQDPLAVTSANIRHDRSERVKAALGLPHEDFRLPRLPGVRDLLATLPYFLTDGPPA